MPRPRSALLFLFLSPLLPTTAHADETVARAALTKLATETTSLRHRLEAADALAKQRGAHMLLAEWAKGNALVRSLAPTCFHAMGVRALGHATVSEEVEAAKASPR